MFICSCNALTDREIKSKARACDGSAEDCYRLLGAKPVCGTCLVNAKRLIDDERANPTGPDRGTPSNKGARVHA